MSLAIVTFNAHHVPSKPFHIRQGVNHPGFNVEVADGIWVVLDLVLDFLEANSPYAATRRFEDMQPNDQAVVEGSAAALTLLLFAMHRFARFRTSTGLFAFGNRRDDFYGSIRRHPHFKRYAPALRWFRSCRCISSCARFAADMYFIGTGYNPLRPPTEEQRREEHDTLIEDLSHSLVTWQHWFAVRSSASQHSQRLSYRR